MDSMNKVASHVIKNNHWLLCSVLEAKEILPAALAKGLLSEEEGKEVEYNAAAMAKMLELLLLRPQDNTFHLFLEVLEENEELKSWAKFLRDEYELMEAQMKYGEFKTDVGECEENSLIISSKHRSKCETLGRLSQNVDVKVKDIQSAVSIEARFIPSPLETPDLKLLREFRRTSKFAEGDIRLLFQIYGTVGELRHVGDEDMKSLLHIASERMGFKVVKMMIEEYNFDPNEQDIEGNTALHIACLAQKAQTVMYLLNTPSCNPNIQNKEGMTALHISVMNGSDVVTKFLLNSGRVDKTVKDPTGKTALDILVESKSELLPILDTGVSLAPTKSKTSSKGSRGKRKEVAIKHKKLHALLNSEDLTARGKHEDKGHDYAGEDNRREVVCKLERISDRQSNEPVFVDNNVSPDRGEHGRLIKDVVLRDKRTLSSGAHLEESIQTTSKKKNCKGHNRLALSIKLWQSLSFLLLSIIVGLLIFILLAVLLYKEKYTDDT